MLEIVPIKLVKWMILIVAIIIEIEACLFLGLAVWMIKRYDCARDYSEPVEVSVKFALDLIYFSHRECKEPTIHIPEDNVNLQLKIDYSKAEAISHRELAFFKAYLIISIFWIITTCIVLVTICVRPSRSVVAFVFWFWFLCIIVGSTLDVIATAFHIKDIIYTSTAVDTFKYIGIKYDEEVWKYIEEYDRIFQQPAKLLISCTSKFQFNVLFATLCVLLSANLSSNGWKNNTLPSSSFLPQTRRIIPANDKKQTSNAEQTHTLVLYFDCESRTTTIVC